MREQAVRLEHHAHVALVRGHLGDVPAADRHGARGGLVQAGEDPQRGRLAAARRAEQGDQLTRLDVQGQPVERLDGAVDPGQVVEFDGDSVRHAGAPGCGAGVIGAVATAAILRRPRVTSERMSSSAKPNSSVASEAATDVGPSLLPIATICTCSV